MKRKKKKPQQNLKKRTAYILAKVRMKHGIRSYQALKRLAYAAYCVKILWQLQSYIEYEIFLTHVEEDMLVNGYDIERFYKLKERAKVGQTVFSIPPNIILNGTMNDVINAFKYHPDRD